jgi:hypothetical protein
MTPPTKGPALVLVACLALAGGSATGCAKPAAKARETPAAAEPGATSEAAKTRELEEKAAGYEERYKEIQESDMTAEQKAQATGDLVDEQQRTVREAEDGPAGEAEADPQR